MKSLWKPTSTIRNPGSRWRLRSHLRDTKKLKAPAWRYAAIALVTFPVLVAGWIGTLGRSLPLPDCLFQATFGFPAPSCGFTRAFIALARGDLSTALMYHAFGPLLLAALVAVAGISTLELVLRRSFLEIYRPLTHYRTLLPLVALYIGYYGLRLWVRYHDLDLPFHWAESRLWQLFVAGAQAL